MKMSYSPRYEDALRRSMPAGAILISFASVVLLVGALGPRPYNVSLSSTLLILALIALCAAILLHVRFLILVRREHREAASVLDVGEREFQSIFDSALDGILILDDQGICLEANPAALDLLGAQRSELVDHSLQKFHPAPDFEEPWTRLLGRDHDHGEMELVGRNGQIKFVEYTVKTNYLPGRHVAVLRDLSDRRQAEAALRESDERFHQISDNIIEVFWILDAETKRVIYANQAYETITGRSCKSLQENPTSYQELFHPEDRVRVLTQLEEAARTGKFDEEFRIIRPDHAIRWVWARGFPVRDSTGVIRRLVGVTQDITARKSAEEQMAKNLAMAESAWAEADAFHKTTLALTQNLSMNYVLDTLLQSLLKLIPCDSARVLLVEAETRLFLAREAHHPEQARRLDKLPTTLDARENRFLTQVLATKSSLLIPNTSEKQEWEDLEGHSRMSSWLCVPLIASQRVLGILSLGDTRPHAFTHEHLHLAKSLAVPGAVAIQNARLYERAEIYGTELEQRLVDLQQIKQALQQAEESRARSEEKFTRVFRSNPLAFCITTVAEGRFIDVNGAFERMYGYSRDGMFGRTVFDTGIWADPSNRSRILKEVADRGRVKNCITRFRKRTGDIFDAIYSAEIIELDGQQCLLSVSEDLSARPDLQNSLDHKSAVAG
jgi:PAS domain S-box-containing protein